MPPVPAQNPLLTCLIPPEVIAGRVGLTLEWMLISFGRLNIGAKVVAVLLAGVRQGCGRAARSRSR